MLKRRSHNTTYITEALASQLKPEVLTPMLHDLVTQEQRLADANEVLCNTTAYLKSEQKITQLKILLSVLRAGNRLA
jgi:hypothetical protein